MLLKHAVAAAALIAIPAQAASYLDRSTDARAVERSIVGGTWTGAFLQRDWAFQFRNEDGKLQGKYKRSDGREWLPLNDLRISGRTVSFAIESKPKVSFELKVGTAGKDMVGAVTIDGVASVPFSASRAP